MQQDTSANNKRIAKNTLFLYFRMLLTMCVGLYTSRVVLNVLGVLDYGVYNVVGGIVNMLAFFNVGMMGATQRFISFDLGKGDGNRLKNTFNTAVLTHIIIILIVVFFSETGGLWLLNTQLRIPVDRMVAANWVFQLSIATFALSILIIPYNSCIIAHEHMGIYAYVSLAEALLKLGVVFCLKYIIVDHLVLYASLIFCIQILINSFYFFYSRHHFSECHFCFIIDKPLLKQMFSFAGWGMIGNTGFTLKDQGSNIILNLFFGPSVNAARAIASHVNGIINGFASNFSMAMNPQITKLYAAGNIDESMKLVYTGARFSFFLLSIIVIPFVINSDYVLHLWLGIVPEYTKIFVFIILIGSLFYSLAHTVSTGIQATGNVKWLQISLSIILLMELPVAYFILKLGGEPYHALLPSLLTIPISVVVRFLILRHYIPQYNLMVFLSGCVFRCILIFVTCLLLSYYVHSIMIAGSFITLLVSSTISVVVTCAIIFVFGLNSNERMYISGKIKKIIKR